MCLSLVYVPSTETIVYSSKLTGPQLIGEEVQGTGYRVPGHLPQAAQGRTAHYLGQIQ